MRIRVNVLGGSAAVLVACVWLWLHGAEGPLAAGGDLDGPPPQAGQVVFGVVRGPVEARGGRWSGVLHTHAGDRMWLVSPAEVAPGQRVRVEGRVEPPTAPRNPGAIDGRTLARQRGVGATLVAYRVDILGENGDWPWRWAHQVRQDWVRTLDAHCGGQAGAVVKGTVVGDRSAIANSTDVAWRAAGIYHALSVSGLHLAVVSLLVYAGLRLALAVIGWPRTRSPSTVALAPTLLVAAAYVCITGAPVATLRALLLFGLLLGFDACGRKVRLVDALSAVCLLVVGAQPEMVLSPSFQLSFAAAYVLALLPSRFFAADPTRRSLARRCLRWIGRWLGAGIWASFWVGTAAAIITWVHFGEVSWGGVLASVVLTPAVELGVLPLALGGVVVAPVSSSVGGAAIGAACKITHAVNWGAQEFAMAIPVEVVRQPSLIVLLLVVCAWLIAFVAVRAGRRRWLAAMLVVGLVALAAHWHRRSPALRLTFLDVGQGDAALIETPSGEVWLIDAGGRPGAATLHAAASPGKIVASALKASGRSQIDVVIVSHPHPDHYLGLRSLADEVRIGEMWTAVDVTSGACLGDRCFESVVAHLRSKGTRVRTPPLGIARVSGGVHLEVLGPGYDWGQPPLVAAADPIRTVNDNSLLLAVRYGGLRAVFLGDAEAEAEEELAARIGRAQIVKVAHHGSDTSSIQPLVDAVRAQYAIISVGRLNRYRLPRPDVVHRWQRAGATVLRTDEHGAVLVTIPASGAIDVQTSLPR